MKGIWMGVVWVGLFAGQSVATDVETREIRHVAIYKEEGRFAGWPANHGLWSWGDEIVVGFETGYLEAKERGHAIDYSRPAAHVLARSRDGGETWTVERPEGLKPPPGIRIAGVPPEPGGKEPVDCPGGIDFTHPDFAITFRMGSFHTGPSRFYYSMDRGRTWEGPFHLPDFGLPGVAARTDYLVEGKHELLAFLTAAKPNRREGRPFVARTADGGKNWEFLSWIAPEPEGYSIMPATVRLTEGSLLTAVRRAEGPRRWIEAYLSRDNGRSWELSSTPVPDAGRGNPASLTRLQDGRLALAYGYRAEPYGLRARLSADGGKTWGSEIVLRTDGGNWDLGYPRTVQRSDGKLVTVYYYNESADGERYIGATIWDPGPAGSAGP